MKQVSSFLTGVVMLAAGSSVPAATLFVNVNSTNPATPYASWSTAATNIQDAVDTANAGDQIFVTNGVYQTGGKSMDGVITNRVSVDKAVLVQSVNGPKDTIIQGALDPTSTNGPGAVRCAWLTNGAVLNGFTLRDGGTRHFNSLINSSGGGVWGTSKSAMVTNCVIATNFSYYQAGGAYQVTLDNCTLTGNHAVGSGVAGSGIAGAGLGGGAVNCNLRNCLVTTNFADQDSGGGTSSCNATNCALINNVSGTFGSGASFGMLVNCTVANNFSRIDYDGSGGAVGNATLINCIVYGNFKAAAFSQAWTGPANYFANQPCNFTNADTDPLPSSGAGNIDANPQLLADDIHLAATSPCIGAGTSTVVSGTDIDGQSWNNSPSIGCDEWHPAPVIAGELSYQINSPAYGLTFNVITAGQAPFNYFWSQNGVPIQDDGHHVNSGTASMTVNHFGPDDAGLYQVVVSNAFGVVTSRVAQVVIHVVDAAGVNPVSPYSTWAAAATNIQDAISVSAAGDIVLVTNGIYATGGKVMTGVSNRIALDKAVTVQSVNGPFVTAIQGAWDPVSTNGPAAIRCAWLTNGAVLSGFTLENGATGTGGMVGGSDDSGGGVYCASTNAAASSTNAVISNCILTNNSSIFGGGICGGILNNSLVTGNLAVYGSGALYSVLNNCTVIYNVGTTISAIGAGTFECAVRNSIVLENTDNLPFPFGTTDNYDTPSAGYSYSCTYPLPPGTGDIDGESNDPQFLDSFHIASTSPCRGAGSALYASGTDLDGEAWADPPSMGCDEVVLSNLVGPLSVSLSASQTNLLVSAPNYPPPAHYDFFFGNITGRVAYVTWSFGDGPTSTNLGPTCSHDWTNTGDYPVTFTAYNTDHPAGVSSSTLIHVLLPNVPQLQPPLLISNSFQFQFAGQSNADYTIQYTTNLAPPVTWQTLQTIYWNLDNVIQINDSAPTNAARFYRVLAQ